jgi:exosortase/archaeosortase family protein
MMYAVAVIIYPSRLVVKAMGIIAGFLIIQILNVIRISGLAYAGVYHKKLFDIIHIYIAQGLMIAVALGVYLLYLYYAEIQSKKFD